MTTIARPDLVPNHHTDVVCEPDCDRAEPCLVCDVDLCEHHTDEFTNVGPHIHHRDCAYACGDCREHLRSLNEKGWSL